MTTAQLNSPRSTHSGAPTISTGSSSRLASAMRPERVEHRVGDRALAQQVVDRVGREPELGEHDERGVVVRRPAVASASVRSALKTGSAGRRWGTAAATRANPWL